MVGADFIRYEPRFIEDVLLYALRGHKREREFQLRRNRLYGIADPEEREKAFQELDQQWFARLELGAPVDQAISEQPLLRLSLDYCLVARAPGKREEGAELFVNPHAGALPGEKPTAALFLRPQSFLDRAALLTFLRRELFHVVDMLDPSFGYEPALPAAEGGPTHDRLLKNRYRILWDTTIDGRMARRGWLPESVRAERLTEFNCAFPMLGRQTEQLFCRFFDRESRTHAELVALAFNPRAALQDSAASPSPGSRCALCGFPTYAFEPEPEILPDEVIAQIAKDFPKWHPSHGLCRQCADIYRALALSTCAVTPVPETCP